MSEAEDKLKALVLGLAPTAADSTNTASGDLQEEPSKSIVTIEDIDDLTKPKKMATYQRVLSNLDYLILSGLSEGKGIDYLCETYSVSENFIKKLMRSDSGNAFLQEQSKIKAETALALTTTAVANGVNKYVQMVDELFEKGNTSLGLNYLFGKLSLMEVQALLHKQQNDAVVDDTDGLKNLFLNIAVKPNA